jgi:hypothetical protein
MPIIDNPGSQVRNFLLLFIIINAIFLAGMRLLPFIDLPNHLAEATIYKQYEPGNLISQFYKPTPWYFPNSFHTVFCSLFPSVEFGNKVFHILCILFLQGSVFLAIKQLRGNQWYGLLALVFTYNYNLTYGFVGFAISIPLLIILFYVILLDIETDRISLKITIAFLLVLLFLMHAQNALLGLVLYGLMMLYHYRSSIMKLLIHGLLIPLPLVILIFTWWFTREQDNEGSTFVYLKEYYTTEYFQNFAMRLRIIVFDNFQLRDGFPGIIIASLIFFCVLFPVVWSRPWRNGFEKPSFSPAQIYAGIFFIITLGCYLLVPDKLPGQTPIFQRFCTIVMLSFIIFASITLKKYEIPWLKNFVVIVVILYHALWFEYIYTFNQSNKNFNRELFSELETGATLAGLIYENHYRGRKVYIHFPGYYIVWKNGIAASKIIDYRFGVVRRVAPESKLPFYHELIGENYSYQPQYRNIDYLLLRGVAPVPVDQNLQGFSLFKISEPWRLYKNSQ